MIIDLTIDRNLDFFGEFHALKRGNKGNPVCPAAFFRVFFAGLFLFRYSTRVTVGARAFKKLHVSFLPLDVNGKKIVDIRYMQSPSELLIGKNDQSVHLRSGTRGRRPS